MSFYDLSSNDSLWRGVDYYEHGNVKSFAVTDDGCVEGYVRGSNGREYKVKISVNHPRQSTCTCPFANGRRVICKHMIALYFTSVPDAYEHFQNDMKRLEIQYEREKEEWRQETLRSIRARVKALTAKQAREELVEMLYQNALDSRYHDDSDCW